MIQTLYGMIIPWSIRTVIDILPKLIGGKMNERQIAKFFKDFGLRLKEIRSERKMTQQDVADQGIDLRFYQRLEAGKPCELRTVLKLSKVFKLSISEMFEGL